MTKDVAVAETNSNLSIFGPTGGEMPSYVMDEELRGAGNEYIGAEDLAIPVIEVLQQLSPEIETVEGAKAGLLFNSVTQELMTECYAVNISYVRDYALFRKRQRGGGFHGNFATQEEARAKIAELPGAADDYDVVETAKHALLLVSPTTGEPLGSALIRFKSTGLSVSKMWNTQLQTVNKDAPRFATVWRITSTKRTKDQNTWYLPAVECVGVAPEAVYQAAKSMFQTLSWS